MNITEEVREQIKVWSVEFKKRNADALMEADDFARIAEVRWVRKLRYFNSRKGTLEQYTGMICSNVESEVANRLKAEKRWRSICDSLDRPVGGKDEGHPLTVADLLNETASQRNRYWLRFDVRMAVSQISPEYRFALDWSMEGYSVREMARLCFMPRNTFVYKIWQPAVEDFKKIFGQSSLGHK